MDFEKKILKLAGEIKVLEDNYLHLRPIRVFNSVRNEYEIINPENRVDYYIKHHEEKRRLENLISIEKLDNNYKLKEPISYNYLAVLDERTSTPLTRKISSSDPDYEEAYKRQKRFLTKGILSTESISSIDDVDSIKDHDDPEVERILDEVHEKLTIPDFKLDIPKSYAVFIKDGKTYVISSLGKDEFRTALTKVAGKKVDYYISDLVSGRVNIPRNLEDVKINVDENGDITDVTGADAVKYYNKKIGTDYGTSTTISDSASSPQGSDTIDSNTTSSPSVPPFLAPYVSNAGNNGNNIGTTDGNNIGVINGNNIVPTTARKPKFRKKSNKLIEKFKNPEVKRKALIAALVLGLSIAAVAAIVHFNPELLTNIKDFLHNLTPGHTPSVSSGVSHVLNSFSDNVNNFAGHINETINNFSGTIGNNIGDFSSKISNVNDAISMVSTGNTNIVAIGDSWAPGAVSGFIRTTAENSIVGGSVDLSGVDTIYPTALDALNGTNGLPISPSARDTVVAVYDQLTGNIQTAADTIQNMAQGGMSL